ncbi:MAG: TRAM domain-containing protein [Candidatus Methanoperedens sp.]|nr:TRAM domain-containing protein [Candidatus Methanoperedenaceae archaeon]MCX9014739.1 TRAM domain-containing protein [Candidatus Methanoperedens sp.]MDW7725862.1 TRAM domain-containing protein [Candidatus Methanoperedens sp.]PKL53433.1 MAG: deoxyribonuclease [Candidatus Methanoperedenaceae archaeon HGW-Methanoperedenaceae-1]
MYTEIDENAPVSAGAVHDVTIEGIAREGDGIARIQGFVIFVPDTKVGDQVKIKIERVMQKFAFAALAETN